MMTVEELIEHLNREDAVYARVWSMMSGGTLTYEQQIRLAGYHQAIVDAEAAIVSHRQGECVLCPPDTLGIKIKG